MPCIKTVLSILKLNCTKYMFVHVNIESSYLCLLVSFFSRMYATTVFICSYVTPIFACMFFWLPVCLLPYLSNCLFIFWLLNSYIQWINQKPSTNKFWLSKSEIQWINQKIGTNYCKRIMIYFAEIFLLQHNYWTRKINDSI